MHLHQDLPCAKIADNFRGIGVFHVPRIVDNRSDLTMHKFEEFRQRRRLARLEVCRKRWFIEFQNQFAIAAGNSSREIGVDFFGFTVLELVGSPEIVGIRSAFNSTGDLFACSVEQHGATDRDQVAIAKISNLAVHSIDSGAIGRFEVS